VDFGLLGEGERCCGLILYLLGLWDEAGVNAEGINKEMRELGVRKIVTGCAGCYYAFTRVYPTLGVNPAFEVYHTSQLMDDAVHLGELQPKALKGSYVWHDPCDLGRHCGVFEPPRRVLRAIQGLELVEPPLNRENTLCCGAGGGLMMYNLDLAERIARSKISDELSRLAVDGVVTGCPACILNLKHAASSTQRNMAVYDLAELVDMCL
jgi:glycolate oxidase